MTNTAKEIMKRFADNNFQPITLNMKANNDTLELMIDKADKERNLGTDNIMIAVCKNASTIAIGGLEPVASYLRKYATDKEDTYAQYTNTATGDLAEIAANTLLDFEQFEPTDTEGIEMDGIAIYKGKTYKVSISAHCDETYLIQAATEIKNQI